MDGNPYEGSLAGFKQDFHLAHVRRFNDKIRSSSGTVRDKDNFLVFNRDGAQLLTPTSDRTPDPKWGDNGMNNYQMTVIPPGETSKMQVGYFTSLKDSRDDTAGWYGPAGWTKEKDALYAKYEKDPVKPMEFNKARNVMRMVIYDKAMKDEGELNEDKKRLEFLVKADYFSTGQGVGTRPLQDGKINKNSMSYERERLDKALTLVNACSKLGDETIRQAGLKKKETLQELREYLNGIGAQPNGVQEDNSTAERGAR